MSTVWYERCQKRRRQHDQFVRNSSRLHSCEEHVAMLFSLFVQTSTRLPVNRFSTASPSAESKQVKETTADRFFVAFTLGLATATFNGNKHLKTAQR